ncbi:hypothetical protein [Paraclostridium bifermentans]|uniref:Uncharacterized protein n=1 Tax=Paraclostridium bifermentans TaxID=1490 RepID=A0A5P3XGX0_PARBF|nr:hypothetical protein [Paraclostridium bifermentans]MDV8113638.1 hypothetical protein [Bacillus sp. BAU-SS-2023]QEZ69461.1 hypothetical protein D4A35_11415 [Paraclostridium bifermentans]QEZ69587.1 hypothetical protein D4A35_12110 [Paraclostridium bifermentans]
MKKEFKVQAISEKIDTLEVHGQRPTTYQCLHNCVRYIWSGNSSSKYKVCYQKRNCNAYRDITQ